MDLLAFSDLSVAPAIGIFCLCAAIVWFAGARLAAYADRLATATRVGGALMGFIVLGGITSLPEIATSITASASGNPQLAVNNLIGSTALQLIMLALVDAVVGRDALTSIIPRPDVLVHAALNIVLLSLVAAFSVAGDWEIPGSGIGIGSVAVFLGYGVCIFVARNIGKGDSWVPRGNVEKTRGRAKGGDTPYEENASVGRLIALIAVSGSVILIAGYALTRAGDSLAEQTGIGSSFFGFLFLGAATSLPEASSAVAAVRRGNPQLAIGDVLGGNLFNMMLIFLVDIVYREEPAMSAAGPFAALAALLGILLCAILLVGMLERRDKAVLRLGYDTFAMIIIYIVGATILFQLRA